MIPSERMDTKMEKRKMLNVRIPQDLMDELRKLKKLRSRAAGRRVTWNELFDEAIGNYIECAENVLAGLGKEE